MAKLISLEEAYGSTTAVAPKRRLISLSEAYGSSAYTPPASEVQEVDDFMSTLALMERVNAEPADQPDYEGPNIELERLRQLERNIEMPPGFDPVRAARFAGSRFINRTARDIRSFAAKLAAGWQAEMGQPSVDVPTPTEVQERGFEIANTPVVQEEAPRDFADKLASVAGELGVDLAELIPAGTIIPGAAAIKALRKGGKLAKLGAAALTTARGAATFGLQSTVPAQEVEEIGHGIGMGAAFGAIEALPGARLPAKVAKTFLEGIALERMTALNATEEDPLLEERMIAFLTPFGLKGASKAAKTLAGIVQGGQSLDTSRKTFDAMGLERTTAAQREAISQGVEAIKQMDPRSPLRQPQPEPTFGPESFTDPAKARAAMEAEVKAAETTPIEGKEAPSGQQVPGNQVQADEGGIRRKGGGLLREDAVRPEPGSPQVEGDAGVGGGEGQPARKGLTRPRDGGSSGPTQETPVEARETAATGRETAAQGPEATVVAPEAGKGKKKGKKGLTRSTWRKTLESVHEQYKDRIDADEGALEFSADDETAALYRPGYTFPDTPEGRSSAKELRARLPKHLQMKVRTVSRDTPEGRWADGNDVMIEIGPDAMAESIIRHAARGPTGRMRRTVEFIDAHPEWFSAEELRAADEWRAAQHPEGRELLKSTAKEAIPRKELQPGDKFEIVGEEFHVEDVDPETGMMTVKDGITREIPVEGELLIDKGSLKPSGKKGLLKKEPQAGKTDLFGEPVKPVYEPATGEQKGLEFGRDIEGKQPTDMGWKNEQGKIEPEMNKDAEERIRRENEENQQGDLFGGEEGDDSWDFGSIIGDVTKRADSEFFEGMGIVAKPKGLKLRSDQLPTPEAVKAPRPEVEANLQKARGVPIKGVLDTIKEHVVQQWHRATRPQEHLPNTEQFAAANEALRLYKDIPVRVSDEAMRAVAAIVDPLGPKQLVLFERKVVMDNLAAAIERGEPLRFGFKDAAEVYAYRKQLDDLITKTPEVQQALEARRKIVRALVKKLVADKILPEAALERADTYYHQQVLAYYEEGRTPRLGKGVKDRKASFQKKRIEGIESLEPLYDYNTSYLEAESKWMADALAKIETKKIEKLLARNYDKMDAFKERAKQMNWEAAVGGPEVVAEINRLRALRDQLREEGKPVGEIAERLAELDPTYAARAKIAQGMARFGKAEGIDDGWIEVDPDSSIFRMLNEAIRKAPNSEQGLAARMVFKGITERNEIIRRLAGDKFMTWERLLSRDPTMDAWQPQEGNVFYVAQSVPEQLVETARRAMLEQASIPLDTIRTVLAMGGPKKTYIFPVELVKQLDSMTKQAADTSLSRELMGMWKAYTLLNPKRLLGYMLRNMTGDIDPVIAGASPALKFVPEAIKDLQKYHGSHLSLSEEMRAARDFSVISSSMTAQEIPQLRDLKVLRRFYENVAAAGGNLERIAKLPDRYYKAAREANEFRENVLRLAVFKYYRRQMKAGKEISHYGGSRKEIVDAIRRTLGDDAAAAHLTRNLLGDYGNLTVSGNWLRNHLIPFYSWIEVNAKRYPRMGLNAIQYGKIKGQGSAAARALYTGMAIGGIGGLTALMWAYNNTVWPDEEGSLTTEDRNSPHIILGRNPDGTVRIFRNTGAMGDFLEWFGVNTLASMYPKYRDGQLTGADIAREMALSPVNKFVQGLRPDLKAGYEFLTGTSLYPDATRPRSQPRGEAIAAAFGLVDEYRELKGRLTGSGERARPNYAQRMIWGVTDPRQNALHEIYDLREDFMRKQGKSTVGTFAQSPAKPMRDAAMAGDYEAFAEARAAYIKSGKNYANFVKTLEGLDPLSQRLSDADERKFVNEFLTGDQRLKLAVARDYAQMLKETMAVWWERAEKTAPSDQAVRAEIAGNRLMQLTDPEPKRKTGESSAKFAERKAKWKAERDKAQAELEVMGLKLSQKKSLLRKEYLSRGGKADSKALKERMRRVR